MGLFSCFSGKPAEPASPNLPVSASQLVSLPVTRTHFQAAPSRTQKTIVGNPLRDVAGLSSEGPASQTAPRAEAPARHPSKHVTILVPLSDEDDMDVPASKGLDQTPKKLKPSLKASTGMQATPDKPENHRDVGVDGGSGVEPVESPPRWGGSKAVKNLSTAIMGAADFASALRPFTDEALDAPVLAYINALGKHGSGLADAASLNPDAGHVFGAAYRLNKMVSSVVVNRENSSMLAGLGQDVVRAVDVAGKKGNVSASALAGLVQLLESCCTAVEVFAKDGWLLHMACNEHVKGEFERAHNDLVEAMETAGLEVPGKATPLPRGAYLDPGRALRRSLKSMGSGSVAHGLKAVEADPLSGEVIKLANQLNVSAQAVARELAALPADVPADVYYSRMVQQQGPVTERYKLIFSWYDKSGRGFLDHAELKAVLSDLGDEGDLDRAFSLANQSNSGRISPDEFARFYDTLTFGHARKQLRLALGLQAESDLKAVFQDFCAFGTRQVVVDMDSAHFVKLFRDCGLLDKDLTSTDIDLAFTKAKGKGERKLTFDGFLTALGVCAERSQTISLEGLVRTILSCKGPIARATKCENVRLHDDKSTYTGVYAKGGPKVAQKQETLAAMLDRSDASNAKKTPVRTSRAAPFLVVDKPAEKVPVQAPQQPNMSMSMRLAGVPAAGNSVSWKRRSTAGGASAGGAATNTALYESWLMWQQFGGGSAPSHAPVAGKVEMGAAQYIKMLRETGILGKDFSSVQAEIIFAKIKPQGGTKLTFEAFEKALGLIAAAKGTSKEEVEHNIMQSGGPMLTPSKA